MTSHRSRKDSGVAWLGDLPDTWSAVPLKQRTALVSRGRSPDYSEDEQGVPIINQACIYWDGVRYDNVKWQRRETLSGERGRIRRGDLLMNSTGTGTLGRVAVFDRSDEYLADSHVTVIRATKDAVPSFLRYVLQTGIYQGYVYSVLAPGATNQIELSREGLRRTPFPMPPVDEQHAIASFLDRKVAAIDALVAKKERLVELLQEKRQALITQAVTKGLDPNVSLKESGVEWLGPIPSHWRVLRLKQVSKRVVVGIAEAATHAYVESGGVPIVRSKNVQPNHLVRTEDTLRIAEWFARKNSSKTVHALDLLTQRTGEYSGVTAVVPEDLDGSQCFTMLITTPSSELNPYFASLFINSRAGNEYFDQTRWGAAQPNISVPILQNVPLALPPRDEQDAIASSVVDADRRHALLVEKVRKHIERLREYRQALVTTAVTGKIDVSKDAA